ncbi:MAG: hypothetical protein R3F60_19285 [bacterium]
MFERCEFNGITPRQAKRRALNYWFTHRASLGMSVADFFRNCRVTDVGGITRITFYGDRIAA